MKGVIIFCFLSLLFASEIISATTISPSDNEVMSLFEKWMVKHGKVYNALGEKAKRFEIFKNNLQFIDEHNKNFPNKTYTLGLNVFADLTDDEYQSRYLGTRIDPEEILSTFNVSDEYLRQDGSESVPDSIDWRSKGYVLPIEDQGECRSSWAFSAICSVEWTLARNGKSLVSLSKQELVDCDKKSNGCNGGDYIYSLYYMTFNGISSEQSYPYEAIDGECRARNKPRVARINGYTRTPVNSDEILKFAVSRQVMSVVVKSNSPEFKLYESGIFNGPCGDKLDHAVNIVGYGSDKGLDYWIVRNSWGTKWGEDGYMRMIRNTKNTDGHCGIGTTPYNPVPASGSVREVEHKSSF